MVRTGDSEDIGSWKIRPIRRPRIAQISRLFGSSLSISVVRPSMSSVIVPLVTRPGLSMMRSSARAVTLLPEPLSPTRARVRPGLELEAHVPGGVEDVRAQVEVDREIAHREHRLAPPWCGMASLGRPFGFVPIGVSYGSAASRNPSPMKLKLSTAITTASDGQISSHGAVAMVRTFCASCSSTP